MRSSNVVAICATACVLVACGSSSKSPSSSIDSGTPPGNTTSGTAWCTFEDGQVVRIVDLATGSYTAVDLSAKNLTPMGIALNSTDAWVIAIDESNHGLATVVRISRATRKVVTTFPLDSSDATVGIQSIAASDSTVWIGGDGSGGPTLYKIDATSSPTAYAVKAAVAPVNQRSNRVLIGNGAIWFLVSNGTEIYEVNPSNPASPAPSLVVNNGSDTGEMAMDANNLYALDSYGHLYSVRQNGFPNVTLSTASTAGFAAPIHVDGNGIYLLPAHGSKQISVVDSTKLTVTRTIGPADGAISAFAMSGGILAASVDKFGELQVFDASSGTTLAQLPGIDAGDLVLE